MDGGQLTEPTAGGTIGPIMNGTTLTMSPARAFATGHVNHVDLISDLAEWTSFARTGNPAPPRHRRGRFTAPASIR